MRKRRAAVHFLRFELGPGQVQVFKDGVPLAAGIDTR